MAPPFKYPKHYEEHEAFPAKTPGLLRVYSMEFCPYAQRARIMLVLHNVKVETINVNLKSKPHWFVDRYDTVPVLEIGDKVIPESMLVAEYIDEVYGIESPIMAKDPYERVQQRLLIDLHGKVTPNFYGQIRAVDGAREKYLAGLDNFEKKIGKKLFFAGEKVGFVDYMIWPWFERQGSWIEDIPSDRFPNLTSWKARMKKDKVIIATATPKEYLKRFIEEMKAESNQYDNYSL